MIVELPAADSRLIPQAQECFIPSMCSHEFGLFRSLVHEQTGIWLREGKQIMLASRLSRRLRHHGLHSFSDYYKFLCSGKENSEELREMINCVTTNKTSFFRENHHFEFLRNTVLPEVRATSSGAGSAIRIWSAACSTGEEPYSIAITLFDALESPAGRFTPLSSAQRCTPRTDLSIHITASDIDTAVLATAKQGVYSTEAIAALDDKTKKKHFLRGKDDMSGHVKVKSHLSDAINFMRLNLMDASWPVEGSLDVIFFRNALIYFQQETQERFLRRMARLLRPGGYLFLGSSEHIPWLNDLFRPLSHTMYQLKK